MNKEFENMFPSLSRRLSDLIEDEEGNITAQKMLMIGTLVIVLGNLLNTDVLATHRSHSSHRSHTSHSSHSSGAYHASHSSHTSHTSHTSAQDVTPHNSHVSNQHSSAPHNNHSNHSNHQSHTSHSNVSSHSNSLYSAEGDVAYKAPSVATIPNLNLQDTVDGGSVNFKVPAFEFQTPQATPKTAFDTLPAAGLLFGDSDSATESTIEQPDRDFYLEDQTGTGNAGEEK